MHGGFGDGDGCLTNRMCDISCGEEGIRSVAMKEVRFLMLSRIHGTEESVDEANLSPDFGMASRLLWDIGR